MTTKSYRKALTTAEKELVALLRQQSVITQKIAQTRQTVLALRTKLAVDHDNSIDFVVPRTLTEACLNAIMASGVPLAAVDVLNRVEGGGFEINAVNKLASVYGVLKRLREQGLIALLYKELPDGTPMLVRRGYFYSGQARRPVPKGWKQFTDLEIEAESDRMRARLRGETE
jgi:hypothetical protein